MCLYYIYYVWTDLGRHNQYIISNAINGRNKDVFGIGLLNERIATVNKLVVNNEMALLIANTISIDFIEHCNIQIQSSIAALVHYSHRHCCIRPCVPHLHPFTQLHPPVISLFLPVIKTTKTISFLH